MAKKVSELPVAQTASDTDQYMVVQSAQSRKQTLAQIKTAILGGNVAALAGLTGAADRIPFFTSSSAMGLLVAGTFGKSLLATANLAAARIALALVAQTSLTDTTPGSVLTVGSFGIGARIDVSGTNLNALITPGQYWHNAVPGAANSAVAAAAGYVDVNIGPLAGSTRYEQLWRQLGPNAIFRRTWNGSVWGAWEVYAMGGANSTITSLTGLTTPLSTAQGGTGNATGLAATATALATSRSISSTGDATWTVNFDGTANVTAALTLANSGVGAGTYEQVTVDAKGRVTAGVATAAFTNLTLTNSWVVQASRRAAYRKMGDSLQLELMVVSGTAADGTAIATLPAGSRPPFDINLPVVSGPNTTPSPTVTTPSIRIIASTGVISCFNCSSATGIFYSGTIPLV